MVIHFSVGGGGGVDDLQYGTVFSANLISCVDMATGMTNNIAWPRPDIASPPTATATPLEFCDCYSSRSH